MHKIFQTFDSEHFNILYCIQGNIEQFLPFRLHCQQANLSLGEFECLQLSLLKHNSYFVWTNSRQGETIRKWRQAKYFNNPVNSSWLSDTNGI